MMGSASGRRRVGPFVYVRFHGVTKYGGRYGDEELQPWADWLRAEHASGRDVFAYFNNDIGGHAPRDAVRLREMVRATAVTEVPAPHPAASPRPNARRPTSHARRYLRTSAFEDPAVALACLAVSLSSGSAASTHRSR